METGDDMDDARHRRSLAITLIAIGISACAHGGDSAATATPRTIASATAPASSAPIPRSAPPEIERIAEGARLSEGLGDLHREVTTRSAEAQAYFDQGLRLTFAFNHDEAARSFARAAVIDPTCAMCFWGASFTLGPNYNVPMLPDRAAAAWAALTAARDSLEGKTAVERDLVAALARRYPGPEYLDPVAMQPHAEAFANAMREVAARHPDDDDVQVLFAEALMDLRPWKLWTAAGEPEPGTMEIVTTLETVLARSASHPGANHYYIHAVEASRDPARAVMAADRLGSMMPNAGHLVHMPAHIYQRVGRYSDASRANREAIESDRRYLASTTPPGYYPMYVAHNQGFLAYSASMEGRRAEALAAARDSARAMPGELVCSMPGFDFFLAGPLFVMVRFGMWDELLAESEPHEHHPVHRALYHHARGMALASRGRETEAQADLEAIRTIAATVPEDLLTGVNSGRTVLALAAKILEARIAEQRRAPEAIALYEQAVALEDSLAYNEPADWFYPVRHYLGAVLLDRRRPREAAAVYRADLERNPENGWALFGLSRALRADRKRAEAAVVQARFERAFANADITLERSAY